MSEQLRIALIASWRHPIRQPFAGGLEAHVWHLARALADRGHSVSLFAAPDSDPQLSCETLTVHRLELSGAARADVSMPPADFMAEHHAYLMLMLHLAERGSGGYDIIHNHSLHYLPVAMAAMLAMPMLTTVHTPPTPWLESAISASANKGSRSRFAAVSAHTAASWAHAGVPLTVVPNGIDIQRWPPGPGGDYLVWFGRITPEKAPHLAIAAARLADKPIVLAGPISEQRYFTDQIAPQLGHSVRYAGHLPQDRLAYLVGSAGVALVTPTWDEPYGLVVAEAMCCGTPVVAFRRGGIPELVAPQAGRLVAPGDVAALADAIPQAIRLSRRRVHQHAVSRCSATAMVDTYLSVYHELISASDGRTHDRLLHPPSRLRASGQGHQHLHPSESPHDGADVTRYSAPASVFGDSQTAP